MFERRCVKGVITGIIMSLLFSCTTPCRRWELSTVKAVYPCSNYAKARLEPHNDFNGIGIEFLGAEGNAAIFLNAYTLCFPAAERDEATADVDLAVGGIVYRFASERLLGGQRIKLTEEAKQLFISALLENVPIEVSVGRYRTTIVSDNFEEIYRRFSIAAKY